MIEQSIITSPDGTDAFRYALGVLAVLRGRQLDRYPDALADVRCDAEPTSERRSCVTTLPDP